MIRHMLLRALERASLENLFDVLRSAEYFVVTMKGEMGIYVRSLDIGDIDTSSGENAATGAVIAGKALYGKSTLLAVIITQFSKRYRGKCRVLVIDTKPDGERQGR